MSHVLVVDRTVPFNPAPYWTIKEPDEHALSTEVDFDKVSFESCLRPREWWITGYEKLRRHAAAGHILADAKIGQALLEEEGQKTLEYLYKEKGATGFELPGTILRSKSPLGNYYFAPFLYRNGVAWRLSHRWLGYGRYAYDPSLVLGHN